MQVFYGHEKWKLGVLRSPIDKLQGKFSFQASSSAGISQGMLNEDAYHALFAYCLLSGQILKTGMPPAKQMAYSADSVLDPSNLTSRVTKLVAVLRKLQVSSLRQLKAAAGDASGKSQQWKSNRLQWLLECLLPWYSKQGQATLA